MRGQMNPSSALAMYRDGSDPVSASTVESMTAVMAEAEAELLVQDLIRQRRLYEQALAGSGVTVKIDTANQQQQTRKPIQEPDVPPSIEEFMALNKVAVEPIPAFPPTDYVDFSNLYFDDSEDYLWGEHFQNDLEEDHDRSGIQLDMKPFQFASADESDEEEVECVVGASKAAGLGTKKTSTEQVKAAAAMVQNLSSAMEALDYSTEEEEEDDEIYLIESEEEGELSSFCIDGDA